MSERPEERRPAFGQTVYDEEGTELGRVRGVDEHGFYVTVADDAVLSREHLVAGREFGEAELMWRCWECGEMGAIAADVPGECPACGAAGEEIYYWTED